MDTFHLPQTSGARAARPPRLLGPALAGLLGLTLTLVVHAKELNSSGDDLGSLPGSGGNGAQHIDTRPGIFLEAPTSEALTGLLSAYAGEFDLYEHQVEGGVRWILRGSGFEVSIDEDLLAARTIHMGIATSPLGGRVLAQVEWPGVTAPAVVLTPGSDLDLPFARLVESDLLDQPMTVRTLAASKRVGRVTLTSGAGLLTLRQE